jgi:hypothetical protein
MIKCSECGYENMDGLDYCDGCGAKLNAAAPGEPSAGPAVHAPAEPAAGTAIQSTTTAPSVAEFPAAEPPPQPPPAEMQPVESSSAVSNADAAAAASPAEEPAPSRAPTGEISAPSPAPAAPEPAAGAPPFKAKLSIIRGGRRGQEFELEPGNNQIGRWDPDTGAFPEVDLDADDPEAKVSRKHALVRIDGGKITIEDTGSLNGTFVNRGARLMPGNPIELKSGDEIIIGKTFLKLAIDPIS